MLLRDLVNVMVRNMTGIMQTSFFQSFISPYKETGDPEGADHFMDHLS